MTTRELERSGCLAFLYSWQASEEAGAEIAAEKKLKISLANQISKIDTDAVANIPSSVVWKNQIQGMVQDAESVIAESRHQRVHHPGRNYSQPRLQRAEM